MRVAASFVLMRDGTEATTWVGGGLFTLKA